MEGPEAENTETANNEKQVEGFDDVWEEQHQILISKQIHQKQQQLSSTQQYFAVPAPNPILPKNILEVNKPKVLIRQIEYYLEPEQLLTSNMHKQVFPQDKPHTINTKRKQQQESCTIWAKYVVSQQYLPVYLKYCKEEVTELYSKGMKKYKLEMSRLCNNNTNLFSSYLIDLGFLGDYGNYLLQSLKTKNMTELLKQQPINQHQNIQFDSRFQHANLYAVFTQKQKKNKVEQYDLILQSDINTKGYSNWFYFSVRVQSKCTVKFNIVNMQKQHTLFTLGMKVAVYSYRKKQKQSLQWHRDGYNYEYYPNQLLKINTEQISNYSTLSFCYDCKYSNDLIYIAANLPYSYTKMLKFIDHVQKMAKFNTNLYLKKQNIASSISSNSCPVITLTWKRDKKKQKLKTRKKIIGVIARQHPSETVSSYVMEGFINDLIMLNNQSSLQLLQNYIFKIVPMVNIDGVIYGNSRCDLSGTDINRKWTRNPNKFVYPIIAGIRNMFNRLKMDQYEFDYFIDFHGHSRQYGTFIYGCKTFDELEYKEFSWIMGKLNTKFVFDYCLFGLSAYKRDTARGIMSEMALKKKSLTLETSFYGYKAGGRKHFDVRDLHKIGSTVLEAISAQTYKNPKIFNWDDLQSEMKQYLDEMKLRRRGNKDRINSDQSSEEGDSDSDPQIDEMNQKQKAQTFLNPTIASKIGLKEVKVVKKTKKKIKQDTPQTKIYESQAKKYERIVDGFNEKLDQFVNKKSELMEEPAQDAQQKLKRTKNYLIRESRSTTKIIPFKFVERSSQKKLSLKKARKSVQLIPHKPQRLPMPDIKLNNKKNNFWSNLKKQYEVLVEEKKLNLMRKNESTQFQFETLKGPITSHLKFRSREFF